MNYALTVIKVLLGIITLVSSAPSRERLYMYIHHCEWAVSNNEHLLLKKKKSIKSYVSREREEDAKKKKKEKKEKNETRERERKPRRK